MNMDADLAAQLDQLREQFSAGLPRRLDAIDAALDACRADIVNDTPLRALLTALHSLGGAAGIFGFVALGEQARHAEHCVKDWLICGGASPQALEQLATVVAGWRPPK